MRVVELINKAWILAGAVGRDLDQVKGSQGIDGLDWLNIVLSEMAEDGMTIPYIQEVEVTMIVGQEKYFVPNLIQASTVTFNLDEVRFSLIRQQINDFKGSFRVNNINSLMVNYYVQRVIGGSDIYFYFKPSQDYPVHINGKFAVGNVQFNDDLNLVADLFFQSYIMYRLANKLALWYGLTPLPGLANELMAGEHRIKTINSPDMTFKPTGLLMGNQALNWAQINVGRGWMPT